MTSEAVMRPQRKMQGRDARGQQRAERDLVGRDQLQRCAVCNRYFIRRRDTVCSRDCLEKLEAQRQHSPAK
jgi:hypothetical protein